MCLVAVLCRSTTGIRGPAVRFGGVTGLHNGGNGGGGCTCKDIHSNLRFLRTPLLVVHRLSGTGLIIRSATALSASKTLPRCHMAERFGFSASLVVVAFIRRSRSLVLSLSVSPHLLCELPATYLPMIIIFPCTDIHLNICSVSIHQMTTTTNVSGGLYEYYCRSQRRNRHRLLLSLVVDQQSVGGVR